MPAEGTTEVLHRGRQFSCRQGGKEGPNLTGETRDWEQADWNMGTPWDSDFVWGVEMLSTGVGSTEQ